MRTLKTFVFTLTLMLAIHFNNDAQQLFHVHEDVVKPSMTSEYEDILKELFKIIEDNPIEDFNMLTLRGYNNHYYYIEPINSMADLDKPSPLASLAKTAGEEKVMSILKRMDKCYDVEKDYIIKLNNELSHMPDGMTQTPEGENYREQYKIYYTPQNRSMMKEKMKSVKDMFITKNSKMHYRVYESGFGTEAEFYLVSISAKDESDMATKSEIHEKLLGEDGKKMMFDMFQTTLNIEEIEGEIRPDLSYNSKK
ncbi:hypothetical protein [Sediminibacter sp. Hel_I_10]|uniref:hypothetical protein n=1 Tax=Sediminibacter sp. Hel_I_10 TaxID=1392490 RepID=UPI0004787D4F|nr:hypothetical protein [Sediminibacter sp. Hel_I_10]